MAADVRRGQTSPGGSILERVLHQYGIVAFGAGGQQRHRALDQLLDVAHVLDGLRRQLAPLAGPLGRLRPTFEALVDRFDARLRVLSGRQTADALAVELVADAHLDLRKAVKDVELREGNTIDPSNLDHLPHQAGVEPAAAPLATGVDAELLTALAQSLAHIVGELGGEWPRADARRIGLGKPKHVADGAWPHAGARGRLRRYRVGGGDEGIGAVIHIEQRAL